MEEAEGRKGNIGKEKGHGRGGRDMYEGKGPGDV